MATHLLSDLSKVILEATFRPDSSELTNIENFYIVAQDSLDIVFKIVKDQEKNAFYIFHKDLYESISDKKLSGGELDIEQILKSYKDAKIDEVETTTKNKEDEL